MLPSAECPPLGVPGSGLATSARAAMSPGAHQGAHLVGDAARVFWVQAQSKCPRGNPGCEPSVFVTVTTSLQPHRPNCLVFTFCLPDSRPPSLGLSPRQWTVRCSQGPWPYHSRRSAEPHTKPARVRRPLEFPVRFL